MFGDGCIGLFEWYKGFILVIKAVWMTIWIDMEMIIGARGDGPRFQNLAISLRQKISSAVRQLSNVHEDSLRENG